MPVTQNFTIYENDMTNLNLMLQQGHEVTIKSDTRGDKIYVDGTYIGDSPVITTLFVGQHVIEAIRGDFQGRETINVDQVGGSSTVQLKMSLDRVFTVNGIPFEMVFVKGGSFGFSDDSYKHDKYPAVLSDYYIGRYEITVKQFKEFVKETGYIPEAEKWEGEKHPIKDALGDNYPVANVSWDDAKAFCDWMSSKTGCLFRLPTEAEWEYAAIGGNKSKGYNYSGSNNISDVAWYKDNSDGHAHLVGTKAPNELGIYDMSGNVKEWCNSWYGGWQSYSDSRINFWGPANGTEKIARGTKYDDETKYNIIADEYFRQKDKTFFLPTLGFRIACKLPNPDAKEGSMTIITDPESAFVTIDGKLCGATPYKWEGKPENYAIKISKPSYEEFEQTVELKLGNSDPLIVIMPRIESPQKSPASFSIDKNTKVKFAKGNLQYQASTKTWRFAENQWDYVGTAKKDKNGNKGGTIKGSDNRNISPTYDGWIDLFAWGTGDDALRKPLLETTQKDFHDWGENTITNGEGKEWFTLSYDDWKYIIETRETQSGIRFAMAKVNGVNGLIILPDDWDAKVYKLSRTNDNKAGFSDNKISVEDWTNKLEPAGAVFLPAAGVSNSVDVDYVSSIGHYWSSSLFANRDPNAVYPNVGHLTFESGFFTVRNWWGYIFNGYSVRLVTLVK